VLGFLVRERIEEITSLTRLLIWTGLKIWEKTQSEEGNNEGLERTKEDRGIEKIKEGRGMTK